MTMTTLSVDAVRDVAARLHRAQNDDNWPLRSLAREFQATPFEMIDFICLHATEFGWTQSQWNFLLQRTFSGEK